MEQETDFRAMVEELGIHPSFELDQLLAYAEQIHVLRKTVEKPVSRSTLLYAALRGQPLVQAVLEANGLRTSTFEQRLTFASPPPLALINPKANVGVTSETTGQALRHYAERWLKRPLDMLGLAACILANTSGQIERHLRTSGLNTDAAAKRLAALADISDGAFIRASESGYTFSGLVRQALGAAGGMIVERNIDYQPLTTSSVLIALQLPNSDSQTATEFLRIYLAAHVADEKRNAVIEQWFNYYPKGRTTSVVDTYTQRLAAVFERAQQIAASASRSNASQGAVIEARHLVGALIASTRWEQDIGSADLFEQLGIDTDALARAFIGWLEQNAPPTGADDLAVWRLFLGIRDETFLARFNAEQSGGDDWLAIDDHVQAFATMIASDVISPPLAIGLFGDWGSGKSFFMAKLREAITHRADRAQKNPKGTPYYSRIVQIEFNAWHYVESNLWASLVENVFTNLKLTTGEDPDSVARRRAELAVKIDALIADRAAAEETLQKAEVARTQAANELEAKTKLAETSAAGLRGLQAVNVWELVQIDDATRTALEEELKKLGLPAALASKDDIRKVLDDLRGVGKRAEVVRGWIVQQPAGVIVLALLLLGLPLVIGGIGVYLRLDTVPAEIFTAISTALVWLSNRVKDANGILDKIDGVRTTIDRQLKTEDDKRHGEIKLADERLKAAVNEVSAAKTTLEAKEKAVAEAKEALIDLSRGRRLARFINERAESDDYRKLLGVLATVRHDFSTLSRLMYPEESDGPVLKDEYKLDRIVLYIDDLDRCHPDRVVEVLQAVHLLLAFKLFVVVVGVDARWVSESLKLKHRALREKSGAEWHEGEEELIGYAAKPHDYLEKIFQVPFWLEPLTSSTTATYIGHLLADDVADENVVPSSGGADQPNILTGGTSGGSTSTGNGSTHRQQSARTQRRQAEVDPRVLKIARKELELMRSDAITKLVGRSPRTAKRFVNTYRFIRAGIASQEIDDYLDDEVNVPAYKGVLILLAIVVGAPDVSVEVLAAIKNEDNAHLTLDAFADNLERAFASREDDEWRRAIELLKTMGNEHIVAALEPHVDEVERYSFRPPYAHLALRKARPRDPFPIRIMDERPRS